MMRTPSVVTRKRTFASAGACRLRLVLLFGVLLGGPPFLCSRGAAEDGFLDKTLQQWLGELQDHDARRRRAAAFALGQMGVDAYDAVPKLTRALLDPDAGVRDAAAFALGDIGPAAGADPVEPLKKLLTEDKDPLVRRSAAYALGSLGTVNVTSVMDLRKALHDPEPLVRQNAAWALGHLNQPVTGQPNEGPSTGTVADLVLALRDRDPVVRRDAADALGIIGRWSHAGLRPLVTAVRQDGDPTVRKSALSAIVNIAGPEDEDLAQDLVSALKDPDPENARAAALALGNIGGAAAAAAVPALRSALHDADANTRQVASAALASVGPAAAPALAELRAQLKDDNAEARRNAVLAIGHIGPRAAAAVGDVAALLDSKQPEPIRLYAAEALAGIGPACEAAIPQLLQTLREDVQPRVRQRALWALAQVDDFEKRGIAAAFETVLADSSTETLALRYEAARFLGLRLGPHTPEKAIDVLEEMLGNHDLVIRQPTTANVSTTGAEARDTKATAVAKTAGDGRALAAEALARIGPRLKRRPQLVNTLRSLQSATDPRLRQAVHDALRAIDANR